MKLYYKAGACALFPHIVLCETSLTFEIESVDLATKTTSSGEDFLKINPKGQIPTLVLEDGTTLTEGVVIAQYIAELAGDNKLLPNNSFFERYRVLEWLNMIAMDLHAAFSPLYRPDTSVAVKEATANNLRNKFSKINNVLNQQDYLVGQDFTLADAYLYVVLTWAQHYNLLVGLPAIKTYFNRIGHRPSVKLARKMEGLTEELSL